MRNRRKNVLLDPFFVEKHALLMAARAEVACLAGERQEIIVPAGVTVDPRKAVVRVTSSLRHSVTSSLLRNLGLDERCKLRERLLPAEIAHLDRDDRRQPFLDHAQFGPARDRQTVYAVA